VINVIRRSDGGGKVGRLMRITPWVIVAALVCACASSASRDMPAVLTNPTQATRVDLRLAVQRALHSDPILLGPDALTTTNLLTIDRFVRRDAAGRPLDGLNFGGRPELFQLVRVNKECVLVHMGVDALRQTLRSATCAPLPRKKR
jgi:hypothetical protein